MKTPPLACLALTLLTAHVARSQEEDPNKTNLEALAANAAAFVDAYNKALTQQAGADSAAATYRIGWNCKRKNFVSWAFDALGGYNKSEWTADDDAWLLRTSGVTANGEISESTQSLEPDPSHQSFTWSRRDQAINDEVQPDRSIRVVKRPPTPVTTPDSTPDSPPTEEK